MTKPTDKQKTVDKGKNVAGTFCGTSPTCFASTTPTTAAVPEPASLGLLGTGLVGLASLARRRFLT